MGRKLANKFQEMIPKFKVSYFTVLTSLVALYCDEYYYLLKGVVQKLRHAILSIIKPPSIIIFC